MARYSLAEIKEKGYKPKEAWWTVFLTDPMAARALWFTCNYTSLTPNQLTLIAAVIGVASAVIFLEGSRWALIIGAVVYHTAFMVDCMDGKTARIKGLESSFGAWLDYAADRLRVALNTFALMVGQFWKTDDPLYLYLAFVVIFLDMLRYIDALQIWRQRRHMREKIIATEEMIAEAIARGATPSMDDVAVASDDADDDPARIRRETAPTAVDLKTEFNRRFGVYVKVRDWLMRHRIRPHLMSGIEYQLFIMIVGPITGQVIWVTIGASAALLIFEIAVIYALWLSNREMDTQLQRMVRRAQREHPGIEVIDPAGVKKGADLRRKLADVWSTEEDA